MWASAAKDIILNVRWLLLQGYGWEMKREMMQQQLLPGLMKTYKLCQTLERGKAEYLNDCKFRVKRRELEESLSGNTDEEGNHKRRVGMPRVSLGLSMDLARRSMTWVCLWGSRPASSGAGIV